MIMLCSVTGCDPMRRINMINKSDGDAEILWVIKKDSIMKSRFFISNSDSVNILLKNKKPYHLAKMSFGTGSWSEAFLSGFADDLESMEIHAVSGNIKLDSAGEIKEFLSVRRRSVDNSKIRIVIK
jgi:hypothetical protein